MPQSHFYSTSHRSPRLYGGLHKHIKDSAALTHFIPSHFIRIETFERSHNQKALFECHTIHSKDAANKQANKSECLSETKICLSSRRSLSKNLRLAVSSPLKKDTTSGNVLHKATGTISGDIRVNRQDYPQQDITWLSPIEKIEVADSEDDDQSRNILSLEDSFFGDLSPINIPETIPEISDESRGLLNVYHINLRNEGPKQSQSTHKDESQSLFKLNNLEEEDAFYKELSTDLSIEIRQIDNVTKKSESEGSIHPMEDMILVGLDDSSC